ncbi:autotransporter domain-containing protein [Desulfobulbus propionicus]
MKLPLYASLTAVLLAPMPGLTMGLPSSFDLRDIDGHSYIGAVRDQAYCGSCYAFGTLVAAESTWNRAHGLYDQQSIDLSEAFMVWSLSPLYDGMGGCAGGQLEDPMTSMVEHGTPLESIYPYPVQDDQWTVIEQPAGQHWDAPRYTMEDWYSIPVNDVETTRRVLHAIGAVTIAVNSDREEWHDYQGGILNDNFRVPTQVNRATMDHAVALIGYNDETGEDGLGYWILRNSWSEEWGEDGYMRLRYTTSMSNIWSFYLIAEPWSGESMHLVNTGDIQAVPWSAGGTYNAHGVDFWGGQASSVVNQGTIGAHAQSDEALTTARGIYLWGGPGGSVRNEGRITASAFSPQGQVFAYGICLQGGKIVNQGTVTAEADSDANFTLSYGVWASNGKNDLVIENSGEIVAKTGAGTLKGSAGIWSESHGRTQVTNTGSISAVSGDWAIGVAFIKGPGWLENSGTITAVASSAQPLLDYQGGVGVWANTPSVIINSGTISGYNNSIVSYDTTRLILQSGSDLVGPAWMAGEADVVLLNGNGMENEVFYGAETLVMHGVDWSLSGNSTFGAIQVEQGRLGIDGVIGGQTTVGAHGILGGNGTLTGSVTNRGTVSPGHSIGQLTIDGDYSQSSSATLGMEIGAGQADRFTVTGTASLDGTLLVVPDGYTSGGSFSLLDAGSISGAFDRVQSAAILDTELLSLSPGSLGLEVSRNSYTSLATPYNQGLAASLDAVRPSAANDFADLLDRLDLALTTSDLNGSLAQMTPRIHGLATTLALDDAQSRFDSLRRRMERFDLSADNRRDASATTVWFEFPGHHSRYEADEASFGATKNVYGLLFGLERTTADGLILGMAGALGEARYESDSSADEGENKSLHAYLYGSWNDPLTPGGWRLGAALGTGLLDFDADRSLPFAGRASHSDHEGRLFGVTVQGGYDWLIGHWILGPSVGGSWVLLNEDGFQESGSGSADLSLGSRESDSLLGFAGARIAYPFQWKTVALEPELRLQWWHEFSRHSDDLHSQLAGGGEMFLTPGRDLAGDSLVMGAALKARLSTSAFAHLGYDCTLQSDNGATDHALSLRVGWMF